MGAKFKHLPPISDADEAEIQREIANDPDAPEATPEQMAKARPFFEMFPELHASIKRGRGRPPLEKPLQQISIRLDPEVIAKFKATGKGWQARVNDALKKAKVS